MIRLLIKNKFKDLNVPLYLLCGTYGYSCIRFSSVVPTGTPASD